MNFVHYLRTGCCILFLATACARAQSTDETINPDVLQSLADDSEETDLASLLEEIETLHAQPLCLESVSLDDLAVLPFLGATDTQRLHPVLDSDSLSWEFIARSATLDPAQLALLRYCCVLRCDDGETPHFSLQARSRFQQEDVPREGFLDGKYGASRPRLQQRLRASMGEHVSAGILIEKDPGELSLTDHMSGYLSVAGDGALRRVVIGDYAVSTGQGLVFWQAFARGKGAGTAQVGRRASLLSPSATATEGLASRGVAVHLGSADWDLLALYSARDRDASIDEETGTAGAFSIDGLHRSASEQARRGSVQERMAGMHARWKQDGKSQSFSVGASALGASYSVPSLTRSPFGFEGNEAWALSLDGAYRSDALHCFAEAALAHTHVAAFIIGMEAQLQEGVEAALLYRRYNERYVCLEASAFGERSGMPQNEEGLYAGLSLRPLRGLRIDLSGDVFRIPNRTYFLHLPTSGSEVMLHLRWRCAVRTLVEARFRRERKDQTVAAFDELGRDIRPLSMRTLSAMRLQFSRELRSGFRIRLRAEYSDARYDTYLPPAQGTAVSAELRWRVLPHLTCTARMTAYRTDSYDARLYQFEHDVRGVMQNLAMHGEGTRSYVLLTWRAGSLVEVGMRYALTIRDGVREFGSGDDAVSDDKIGVLSVQIDVSL